MEQEAKVTTFRGFYGNHHHSIDTKNRAFVPAKFRDGVESGFMLTKGLDECLFGYQFEEWQKMAAKLQEIPVTDGEGRAFLRFFVGNATDCDVDKQGRFSIPQSLREYAHLTKDFCFVGMMDHFEIWDSEKWKEESLKYDSRADMRAEKMQKYLKPAGAAASVAAV